MISFEGNPLTLTPEERKNLIQLEIDDYVGFIPTDLINLQVLEINFNYEIREIPKELVNLTWLVCIESPNLKEIPETLVNLESLVILECPLVKKIPETIKKLKDLVAPCIEEVHDNLYQIEKICYGKDEDFDDPEVQKENLKEYKDSVKKRKLEKIKMITKTKLCDDLSRELLEYL